MTPPGAASPGRLGVRAGGEVALPGQPCPRCYGTGVVPDDRAIGAAKRRERVAAKLSLRAMAYRMGESTQRPAFHPAEGGSSLVAAVRAFHETFGVPVGGSWPDADRRNLRFDLILEEFDEWCDAFCALDSYGALDALVDMVYVIVGAAIEFGWDFDGAFAAVHAANMAKLGPDGKPIMRADGKVLKPEGWRAPDLTPFLAPPPPRASEPATMAEEERP